jgi:hypothetical protein
MIRHKARPSAQTIARDFPYVVEISVPEKGLGQRLEAMHEFHTRRGIRARNGPHRQTGSHGYITWCFSESATAETFAAEFKGKLQSKKLRPAAVKR